MFRALILFILSSLDLFHGIIIIIISDLCCEVHGQQVRERVVCLTSVQSGRGKGRHHMKRCGPRAESGQGNGR